MTTMTNAALDAAPARDRYGLRQVTRAEFTKLRTVRSTTWALVATVIGTLGVTVLSTVSTLHHPARWYQGFDTTNQILAGLALGSLVIGILGVLVVTSEYGTGTIRSSFAAVPVRRTLFVGKALVLAAVALVVGEVLTVACFELGRTIMATSPAPRVSLGQPGVLRAVLMSGASLGLLGLFGVGIGAAIRRTAGAIGVYVGFVFVLPLLLSRIGQDLARFSPIIILANSVATVLRNGGQLSPWSGFLVLAGYAAAALLVGGVVMVRRDP